MKVTRKNLNFYQVVELMNNTAKACAVMFDCNLIISDMAYAIASLSNWSHFGTKIPFYIAVRLQGVEDGEKEYVEKRCQHLGKAMILFRLDQDANGITITKEI